VNGAPSRARDNARPSGNASVQRQRPWAYAIAGSLRSRPVPQADRRRNSAAPPIDNSSGSRRWTMRAIRGGPPIGRLPKGVSHERARRPRQLSPIRAEALMVKSDRPVQNAG
jgi:hypothetical protein